MGNFSFSFSFLGSGPVGDDDLWHHHIGRFSPFFFSFSFDLRAGRMDLWFFAPEFNSDATQCFGYLMMFRKDKAFNDV